MNDYYTYCYLTVTKRPYYIGMGRGYRATRQHPTLDVSIPDDPALIIILKSGLTQEEAWKHEEYMIAVLGRQCDGGLLFNKARGGAGWGGGSPCTPERKARIGKANSGRVLSVEHKQKLSVAKKGKKQTAQAVANRAQAVRRSITLLSPSGEIITFDSHLQAADCVGAHYTNLTRLKSGRLKTIKGWSLAPQQ